MIKQKKKISIKELKISSPEKKKWKLSKIRDILHSLGLKRDILDLRFLKSGIFPYLLIYANPEIQMCKKSSRKRQNELCVKKEETWHKISVKSIELRECCRMLYK